MSTDTEQQPAPEPDAREKPHRFLWDHEMLGKDVWDAACERMHEAFDRYDVIEVLSSGGKDSMAALEVAAHVAAERGRLPLKVGYVDDEITTYETKEYLLRQMAERDDLDIDWLCFPIAQRNACTSEDDAVWYPWAPEEEHLWCRPMPDFALHPGNVDWYDDPLPQDRPNFAQFTNHWAMARNPGKTVGLVMGIRAGESLIRRQVVSYHAEDNYVIKVTPTLHKVYAVYDWTTADIWRCAARFGWDYNHTYDVYEMLGKPIDQQRIGTPFADEPIQRLPEWQEIAPDIWDKMLERVPGAHSAGRYATTELYAFGSLPEKPPALTWPQFIRQTIDNNESAQFRAQTAKKVRNAIGHHYRKTSDPLLEVAHPVTGISWPGLLRMAVRGDAKNRKFLSMRRGDPEEYAAALAEHRAATREKRAPTTRTRRNTKSRSAVQ